MVVSGRDGRARAERGRVHGRARARRRRHRRLLVDVGGDRHAPRARSRRAARAGACSTAATRSRPRSPRRWAASSGSTSAGAARSSPSCRSPLRHPRLAPRRACRRCRRRSAAGGGTVFRRPAPTAGRRRDGSRSRCSSSGSSRSSPTCARSSRRSRASTSSTLSLLLLVTGVAGLLGTWLIGVRAPDAALPRADRDAARDGGHRRGAHRVRRRARCRWRILLAVWGLLGTAAPVGWWTWLSRCSPTTPRPAAG